MYSRPASHLGNYYRRVSIMTCDLHDVRTFNLNRVIYFVEQEIDADRDWYCCRVSTVIEHPRVVPQSVCTAVGIYLVGDCG